jgi:hypothetical protein
MCAQEIERVVVAVVGQVNVPLRRDGAQQGQVAIKEALAECSHVDDYTTVLFSFAVD